MLCEFCNLQKEIKYQWLSLGEETLGEKNAQHIHSIKGCHMDFKRLICDDCMTIQLIASGFTIKIINHLVKDKLRSHK